MLYPYHRWYIHIIISVIYPSVLQFHWRFQSPILFQYKTSTHSKNQDMEAEHGPFLEETVFFFSLKVVDCQVLPALFQFSQWWEIFPTTWGFSPIFDPYFKVYTLDHFILCALDSRCTATTPVGFLLSFCDKFFFFGFWTRHFQKQKMVWKKKLEWIFLFVSEKSKECDSKFLLGKQRIESWICDGRAQFIVRNWENSAWKLMAGLWLLCGIPKRTLRPSFVSTVVARPETISFQNAYVFFSAFGKQNWE